ncbi:hypothetical protein GF386_05440 [Candidatus Pacearchaeota archaeon]|nr:hypothetical protein [Candidatus Pacearchaeota archaeon]MBD3283534.1 hypothetical protein [Candidatus Pacearchaeota archaeon]
MPDFGGRLTEIFGGVGGAGGFYGIAKLIFWVFILLGVFGLCGLFLWYLLKKKRSWNLKAEIKIPRSDGRLLTAEWGKGAYDTKRGVVWIKRRRKSPVPMKPFNIEKYIQGQDSIITVQQVSPDHYIPLLYESFTEMEDDKTGETASFAKIKSDFSESKSWKNQFERESKGAYTVLSLLKEYAPYIGVGIILFMNFVGFAILYTKIA